MEEEREVAQGLRDDVQCSSAAGIVEHMTKARSESTTR